MMTRSFPILLMNCRQSQPAKTLTRSKKYTASATYANSQKKLINQTFSERSVEPIIINSASTRENIRDAISANNIIRSLDSNLLLRESTSYAIANPGFEEFTTWNLISRPADFEHAKKQLSSNVYSSLKVERECAGYIQQLVRKQLPGTRTILMNEKGLITSSVLTQPETNALVKLSGQGDKKMP